MSDDDGLLDRVLYAYVTRVSGRTVALTALALYPGIGLALPLALGWSDSWLVAMNLLGVSFAAALSLVWLAIQLQASHRRHLLDWTTNLRLVNSEEFEWLVGEVFRREGWSVKETGSQAGPDGNIDLVLTKGRNRRFVQCKRWQSWQIPIDEIRSFAGAVHREGGKAADGIFVTLSTFNGHATSEARKFGMTLIDGRELYNRAEAVRRIEPCPVCARPMLLDRSAHGWWFRCTTRGCRGKRDLDADAARVVDLLTQPPATPATPAVHD